MDNTTLQALIALAPTITTNTLLFMMLILERRRADRLEAIALNRQDQRERMEMLKQGEV